ncbi:phosphoethanolamine N-methyltransferase-like isoform X1 [Anneissia japonica]|uniref:phosphoethanolamine N-methyltransferase-like isoform X1 n=2 Tax=Anneissia japonica TaxID=1529436 RepID=UPI001425AA70|nr:phosphoethanolamine N-methyltransferase-like isoform X1 [Anneissia japonica]
MAVCDNKGDRTREEMSAFWQQHSQEATLEKMFLDSQVKEISQVEEIEILNLMCDVKEKNVLELGSGIGRYTGKLALDANHVTSLDFMESFVLKSKEINGHMKNITFLTADVTSQDFEPESFDVVFSNWLLMYLSDDEVNDLLIKIVKWTKPGGNIFFRESCFRIPGVSKLDFNPTNYRTPSVYSAMFQLAKAGTPPHGLDILFCRNLKSFMELKKNHYQCVWLLEKAFRTTTSSQHGYNTFQQFLDNQQYTQNGILRYERIFGPGFVSTGGKDTTEEFVAMLDLKPGQKVLDVGSGIGGGDFYIEQKYGADVLGIDSSVNIVEIAMERSPADTKVQFQICDVTTVEFGSESFDVVYSRDTLLHIADKPAVFKKFMRWLKPGGKLLISDYCHGDCEHSEKFKSYVAQRGYVLYTVQRYGKMLEEDGFVNVKAEDRSKQFASILKQERAQTEANKQDFIKDFSEADYNYIVDEWADKLGHVEMGDQAWGLFYAEKPL